MRELFVFIIVAVIAAQPVASGQTLLRWKLKPGEALAVEIEQHTDSQVAFSGKTAATKIYLTLKLGWQVTAADNENFTIRQTVERIQQKITTPQAATIEYDSAATGRPSGQARDLAEAHKPLVVLPEKEVSAGDTWTVSNDRTAATGALKLDTTYRLDGLTDQDGKRLAKIGLTAKATRG
ncbi:MAG TPA: hypothetical protein VKH44_04895, partial [Pirellulaceae bacterium]|nr:hypothetical protein [Pirellulaceae bacterium]